jgi:hypothetical protein
MNSATKCKGCGKLVQSDAKFCPECGYSLGVLEDRYVFKTMNEYASVSEENLRHFLEVLENPEKLEERFTEEKPQIFEKQREITQKILDRFPDIRRYVIEEQEVEFNVFMISMPYHKESEVLQHDCLLRQLAIHQNGLVNFSLGSAQLATDFYAFDVPIWAPKKIGHELLSDQQQQVRSLMPSAQRKFLSSAEPWWVCSKVFDLDGRWINWRLLFRTEGFEDYAEENEEVPLNFHLFSNMKYSDLFSIAGTHGDGEVLVGLYEVEENEIFKKQLSQLQHLYEFGKEPEVKTIRISWQTLEHLGLIGYSAQQLLRMERSHFFQRTLEGKIVESVRNKTAQDTKGAMTSERIPSADEFVGRQAKRFLWLGSEGCQGGSVRITHGIPRELRKEYRVLGGDEV